MKQSFSAGAASY